MAAALAPLRLRVHFITRLLPHRAPASPLTSLRHLPSPRTTITTTTPTTPFSTTAKMPSSYDSTSLKSAMELRRSIYALNKTSPIPDSKIEELARTVIEQVPSSFNSQSARLVVLLKDDHDKFWSFVRDVLKTIVPEDKWEHTGNRIQMFAEGYGTVLFYEAPEPIKNLQSTFPMYADKFPQWSEHTSAMHQYAMWTALEAEGFGCNLQHYNPLADQQAANEWKIPLEWSMKAQLVFGGLKEGAREGLNAKEQQPVGERLFVHGAAK